MNSTIESTLDTNQTTTIQSYSFLASLIVEILSSNSFSLVICVIWLLLVVLAVLGKFIFHNFKVCFCFIVLTFFKETALSLSLHLCLENSTT